MRSFSTAIISSFATGDLDFSGDLFSIFFANSSTGILIAKFLFVNDYLFSEILLAGME
jgi:hypothetical protein